MMGCGEADTRIGMGIDIGGTKIAAGLVDVSTGAVRHREIHPTRPRRGGAAVLEDVVRIGRNLQQRILAEGHRPAGLGLAVAELVDPEGRVTSGQTIRWEEVDVYGAFKDLPAPVIEADVRAAARAEALYGSGKTYDPFVYVTVGTGIASCLVQGGFLYTGARGNALILSSGRTTMWCPRCGEKVSRILEEYASGPAMVQRYNRRAGRELTRAEQVLSDAAAGDQDAREVVKSAGEALGSRVGLLINILDPAALVVGGGLGSADGLYWDRFLAATREHIWSHDTRELPIIHGELAGNAAMIGAAVAGTLGFTRPERGDRTGGAAP